MLKKGTARQIHTQKKSSRQLLTSHTAQRAVRRPIEHSPIAPNKPLCSANLRATHSHGGRIDANASHALATRPGGGRNCPCFSHDDTAPQPFSNESQLHFRIRSQWFTRRPRIYALLCVAYWKRLLCTRSLGIPCKQRRCRDPTWKSAVRVQSLTSSRPNGGRQAYRATSFEGSEGLSALRADLLPVTGRG